jgi:hypothetical protein
VIKAKIRSKASSEEIAKFGPAVRTLLWYRDRVTMDVEIDGQTYGVVFNRRPVSSEEIAEDLKCTGQTIHLHIDKLRKLGAIITRHATWGLIVAVVGSERWKGSKALDDQGRPRDCKDPATIRTVSKTLRVGMFKSGRPSADSGSSHRTSIQDVQRAGSVIEADRILSSGGTAAGRSIECQNGIDSPERVLIPPCNSSATIYTATASIERTGQPH